MSNPILLVVWEFPPGPGGIGQHAYSLARAIQAKGGKVIVVTSADYLLASEIEKFDAKHLDWKIFRVTTRIPLIKQFIRAFRVIQTARKFHASKAFFSGKGALWLIPWVRIFMRSGSLSAILHGSEINLSNRVLRRYTHYCLGKAHNLFPVSTFTRSLLPARLRESNKVHVVPNGINRSELENINQLDTILKGQPALLTVGQITRRKGQHNVVKALPWLVKRWPALHYHIVGLPTLGEQLMDKARHLGVANYITIHGFQSRQDVLQFYKASDIFVMLSETQDNGDVEGFGIAILEANFFAKPAIGSRGCGIEDAINNGETGYLVDNHNPDQLLQAIDCILKDYKLFSKQAHSWSMKFEWNELVDRIIFP